MPSNSSTLPAVKAALVSLLETALASSGVSGGQIPVQYAWTPDAADEMVFLGRREGGAPFWSTRIESQIPGMKAGRKARRETYNVDLTVWTYRGDLTPADAAEAEARLFVLLAKVEDVLANDTSLDLLSIHWGAISEIEVTGREHDAGWRVEAVVTIEVTATLN